MAWQSWASIGCAEGHELHYSSAKIEIISKIATVRAIIEARAYQVSCNRIDNLSTELFLMATARKLIQKRMRSKTKPDLHQPHK